MGNLKIKKQNKRTERYRKTDNAIFLAIYRIIKVKPSTISVRVTDITRNAGINLSTFYRHFKTPDDVISAYEARVLREYYSIKKKCDRKKLTNKQWLYQILFFICKNEEFFNLEFCRNNEKPVRKIFNMTKVTFKFEKFYDSLKEWAKINFDIDSMEKIMREIMR